MGIHKRLSPAKRKYVRLCDRPDQRATSYITTAPTYLDVAEHDRIYQNGPAYPYGPSCDAEAVALSPQFAWEYLCRDQESDRAPCCSIYKIEQKEHAHCSRCHTIDNRRVMACRFIERRSLCRVSFARMDMISAAHTTRFTMARPRAPPIKHLRLPKRSTI